MSVSATSNSGAALGAVLRRSFSTHRTASITERFEADFRKLAPQRRALCQQFGIDPDLPVFLFCGKLIPIKQPASAVGRFPGSRPPSTRPAGLRREWRALFRIGEQNPFRKPGRGPSAGFLQSKQDAPGLCTWMICSVLFSSEDETWGLVVNEALACGRPVLISDRVGCGPDLISPENGWIVPFDHPDLLPKSLDSSFEGLFQMD